MSEFLTTPGILDVPSAFGGGVECVECVENDTLDLELVSPSSTFSPSPLDLQQAIYPESSWLARYMDYARTREESADCYLLAPILPVMAACMGRNICFSWGDRYVYPNLFVLLAGKPGDRKSSAINLAGHVAKKVLEPKHFLPDAMSAEALFDEYDEAKGGSPDKILIADDANPFLGLLQKSNYGERVGQRLLNLYDCKGLWESFRRNADTDNNSRRMISETSTNLVLGATFNICQFKGHEIRSGLQRRFLYYAAETHGRFIAVPPKSAHLEFIGIVEKLKRISKVNRHAFIFEPSALERWVDFQKNNRQQMEKIGFDDDTHVSRLNGQPEHVLKLAMIFQVGLWLETESPLPAEISRDILEKAIEHSELCLLAGKELESISRRVEIQNEADVLIAKIAVDFISQEKGGVTLTKTQITAKYASHAGRKGGLSADDLYLRLIPNLIRRRLAQEISRPGKQPSFKFLTGKLI
jgi:hypothetical protein